MDNVKLFSNKVWIAEDQSDPDALIAKIVICDFSVNKNGVQLNRETITDWMASLVTSPLVGKIKAKSNGEIDFTSHNATVVTRIDESGNEYTDIELNTDAFGTFTDVQIDTIDGVECIVATARCWRRFYDATNLIIKRIKEGTLFTSWEISVENAEKKILGGTLVKVINKGRFLGHALLSVNTSPAYDISRVLEVAAKDESEDEQLCSALIRDVMKLNNNKIEVQKMDGKEKPIETSVEEINTGGAENGEKEGEETPSSAEETRPAEGQEKEVTEPVVEHVPDRAELTMRDLRWKIEESLYKFADKYLDVVFIFVESHIGWAHDWSEKETDMHEFSYVVENDEVTISGINPVSLVVAPRNINSAFDEKVSALSEAQSKIESLTAQVSALAPYKEAAEKAAKEKAELERREAVVALRKYAEDSDVFTKDELASGEIFDMINNLKDVEIKVLISDRNVAKKKRPSTEVSTKRQPEIRLDISSTTVDGDSFSVFKTFLAGK